MPSAVHRSAAPLRVVPAPRREPVVESAVLGMLIFVLTEAMLFAGLISAFSIVKASVFQWPPPGQPRLPVEETALNTAALLLSGAALVYASRVFRRHRQGARRPLLVAMALGAFFVLFQGLEWVALIREGLTLTSSIHGSFFYLIVGLHALHAVAGLVLLAYTYTRFQRGPVTTGLFAATQIFWYFVVGLWPVLYVLVYL